MVFVFYHLVLFTGNCQGNQRKFIQRSKCILDISFIYLMVLEMVFFGFLSVELSIKSYLDIFSEYDLQIQRRFTFLHYYLQISKHFRRMKELLGPLWDLLSLTCESLSQKVSEKFALIDSVGQWNFWLL